MFVRGNGTRPMETVNIDKDADPTEPLMTLDRAINSLPFFQRYSVFKRALLPVIETKAAELLQVDFDGQIRARVAYINSHIDKLYYTGREEVIKYVLPRLIRTAEQIQEEIERSNLTQTQVGRRLAMVMGTALMVELLSALPDTMRDGNQRLMGNVASAMGEE